MGFLVYLVYCLSHLDDLVFSLAGPGAGVGGGRGGRGCVWHHTAQGARPASLRHVGATYSLQLRPVPHGEGAQAKGCHLGAVGHPPVGP